MRSPNNHSLLKYNERFMYFKWYHGKRIGAKYVSIAVKHYIRNFGFNIFYDNKYTVIPYFIQFVDYKL